MKKIFITTLALIFPLTVFAGIYPQSWLNNSTYTTTYPSPVNSAIPSVDSPCFTNLLGGNCILNFWSQLNSALIGTSTTATTTFATTTIVAIGTTTSAFNKGPLNNFAASSTVKLTNTGSYAAPVNSKCEPRYSFYASDNYSLGASWGLGSSADYSVNIGGCDTSSNDYAYFSSTSVQIDSAYFKVNTNTGITNNLGYTTVLGSVSGSCLISEPEQGTWKEVDVTCLNLNGAITWNMPSPFFNNYGAMVSTNQNSSVSSYSSYNQIILFTFGATSFSTQIIGY